MLAETYLQERENGNGSFVDKRAFGRDITNKNSYKNNYIEPSIPKVRSFSLSKPNRSISYNPKPRPTTSIPTSSKQLEIRNTLKENPYINEIYEFGKQCSSLNVPIYGYFSTIQFDINEKMRGILVDWIIEVHLKFKLRDETLFLCINIIDRYLSVKAVIRQKLQLVGVSALLIACKYEEIYAPEVKDFVYITDNAYTRSEVLNMESEIVYELNFNLLTHSTLFFLNRISSIIGSSSEEINLSRYLIELCLCSYSMLKFSPIYISSASIFVSRKLLMKELCWPSLLEEFTELREMDVRECSKDICLMLASSQLNSFKSIKKKFASEKYMSVSNIQIEKRK